MLVLTVFCLAVLVCSQPSLSPSSLQPLGIWGARVANGKRGLGLGLWRLLPSSPFPLQLLFVTGSDGHLPGCVASVCI